MDTMEVIALSSLLVLKAHGQFLPQQLQSLSMNPYQNFFPANIGSDYSEDGAEAQSKKNPAEARSKKIHLYHHTQSFQL